MIWELEFVRTRSSQWNWQNLSHMSLWTWSRVRCHFLNIDWSSINYPGRLHTWLLIQDHIWVNYYLGYPIWQRLGAWNLISKGIHIYPYSWLMLNILIETSLGNWLSIIKKPKYETMNTHYVSRTVEISHILSRGLLPQHLHQLVLHPLGFY